MAFEKKYNKEKEKEIRKFWEENKIFKFNKNTTKKIFSIDTPPPTVSGKMHIGHAYSYSQQDFIARFKRMKGYEVYFPFGTDDNGLATEKLVQKTKNVNLRKIEREEAIKICLDFLGEERPKFIEDWKRIGMSCDFSINYSTIDDYSRKISQKSFLDLYKKGLVKRREGPIMWDRVFETAIAQAELEDKKRKSYLNYIKARVKNTYDTFLIYATTRPELIFACVGMSIDDKGNYIKLKVGDEYWITGEKTYKEVFKDFDYEIVEKLKGEDLIDEKVILPLTNKEIEISQDITVQADFGTGIAYFCTFGGLEDIEWAARHKVEPISILDTKGRLNHLCEKYEGMLAEEARKEIIKEFEDKKFLIKKEIKEQVVNVGERSGVEVEFIISKQWYVKILDKKEYLWEQAQKLNWFPDYMKHRLENWIKGLQWDWSISRQRHFGIPIPVWYDKKGNIYLPNEEQLPVDPLKDRPKSAPKNIELIPEKDVFDTWFTSASSPFLAINLIKNEETKKKLFPIDLRPQAHDIINFWLFYTMTKTNLLYDTNPFKNVTISGWVLAPDGTKMSKSKGNTIAPQNIIKKYSSDALRFAAASSKLGQDLPFQEKDVQTGIKVVNKLYNANKFASMLLKDFTKEDREFNFEKLKSIDKWIIAKAQKVIKGSTESFENYEYSKAKSLFTNYFMHNIADNYIEIVKQRLWNPDIYGEDTIKSQQALYYALYTSLKGLAPFLVFITEEIYQNFYREFEETISIHKTKWPEYIKNYDKEDIVSKGDKFIEIISEVRKYKAEKQQSMKTEIEKLIVNVDKETKAFIEDSLEDLKNVTNVKKIEFRENKEDEFKVEIINN